MDAFGADAPTVAVGDRRPPGNPGRWLMIAISAVAAAGFTACLDSVYTGMRDVIATTGGFCASGGPYVVAHQCSAADTRLRFIGVLGMLVSGAVFAGFSAWADGPVLVPGLLMWSALFGALGWKFIDLSSGLQTRVDPGFWSAASCSG